MGQCPRSKRQVGFIVQMPDATEEDITAVENGLHRFGAVTDHFAASKTPEELVQIVLSDGQSGDIGENTY